MLVLYEEDVKIDYDKEVITWAVSVYTRNSS
jgi:hypothetical protein